MENYKSLGIIATALLLVVWQSKTILADENGLCTCYSFNTTKKNWDTSKQYCQHNGGFLVSMETEKEYQFINKTIQSLDVEDNEWYIGLSGSNPPKEGSWKWINGHSMTINKWMRGEPSGPPSHRSSERRVCVKMVKVYRGLGLFADVSCGLRYMFICEYETGKKCPSSSAGNPKFFEHGCTSHRVATKKDYTTTASLSPTTKETTTTPTHPSTIVKHSHPSPPTDHISTIRQTTIQEVLVSLTTENGATRTTQKIDVNNPKAKSSGSSSFPLVIVTVVLGAVLAVSVCLLLFVCYWKRMNKGDKNEKTRLETASLPPDATGHSSKNNQLGPEDGGFPEGVQLFTQNGGEPYVAYAVIHNNLAEQNKGPNASNEPAYASIQDEDRKNMPSQKNDSNAATPAATMNAENSGNSVGDGKSNAEVVYASVDKSKKNNIKNESKNGNQWPSGQQVLYASVDNSKKSKYQAEDAVYAEVGSKDNMEKQQPYQITYAELADFNQNRSPEEAVKPAPYQPAEYAVIVGQKQKS